MNCIPLSVTSVFGTPKRVIIFSKEILSCLGHDVCLWLDLYPLDEIINCYQQEFSLPQSFGRGLKNIHSPNSERPRGDH